MKAKLLSLAIILTTSILMVNAQENKTVINLGAGVLYGVGGSISCDHRTLNWNEHSALTVGGYAGIQRGNGYAMTGSNSHLDYDYKWLISPRLGYVYSFNQRFELFAALMPGLLINDKYDKPAKYEFFAGATGGGRLQLFKNIYVFTEFGYNILCLNAGISVKF
jgi:hypothetical protein